MIMVPDSATDSLSVGLISMPWALFNRPSIQLGALAAYVEKTLQIKADCFHPYLVLAQSLGTEIYQQISLKPWAGESIFAALLYPENKENCRKVYYQCLKGRKEIATFSEVTAKAATAVNYYFSAIDFSKYRLIGFSVCFDQLFSSLYAAKWIKNHYPQVKIVFGGSSCCSKVGESLVKNFGQIDFIIDGEGELALCTLIKTLITKPSTSIPAVIQAEGHSKLDLDTLPPPDFTNYFRELTQSFPEKPFEPVLPVEFSRGCWWGKCSFCNLNIQWNDYRGKKAETVAAEVVSHSVKYESLDFTFTDNALPPKEADRFFDAAAGQKKDFSFFAEIRAITGEKKIQAYRKGGLNSVQVGIEAFSDSLLQKMQKGTRTIDNIAVMKYCMMHGVTLDGNIITHFPTSTRQEVEETLTALDFVLPYHPLSTARFFLGYGSPVDKNPAGYGLQARIHRFNHLLFPDSVQKYLIYLHKDYTGDKTIQNELWKDVSLKVERWQQFHQARKHSAFPLSYRDGEMFLIIRQEQENNKVLRHKLKGISRQIYLSCTEPQNIDTLLEIFNGLNKEKLIPFLHSLHQKRILYFDGTRALALAIHQP